jgi:DNA-binding SARP family transcriptional activator
MALKLGAQPSFRLLGLVEVEGVPREALGGPKQRALLAYLLLHANELVARDRLIDAVWGEQAPPTAAKIVQLYVAKLRGSLAETPARIVTRAPGYVLELDADELDSSRFERLARDARAELRAGEPARACELLDEALALWHGEALADVAAEAVAQIEATRLDELRLGATIDRIEAALQLGELPIADIEHLVARHPFEERLRGQLILALYRSGRQTDALAAYQEARKTLVSEIGVEPGPALRELEQAILRHDPALAPPPASAPAAPPAGAPARRRRRWVVTAAAAALAVVSATVAVIAATRWESGGVPQVKGLTRIDRDSVGLIDPGTGRIVAQVQVGKGPRALAAAAGTLWVADFDGQAVTRVNERTRRTTTILVGGHPTAIVADANGAWVANGPERTLVRVDADFERVAVTVPVLSITGPSEVNAVARTGRYLWDAVDRLFLEGRDAATGKLLRPQRLLDLGAESLAVDGSTLWIGGRSPYVTAFDLSRGIPVGEPISILGAPSALAAAGGRLWAVVGRTNLQEIDTTRSMLTNTIRLPAVAHSVTATADAAFVALPSAGAVLRVDAVTHARRTIRIGATPNAVLATRSGVWVAAS